MKIDICPVCGRAGVNLFYKIIVGTANIGHPLQHAEYDICASCCKSMQNKLEGRLKTVKERVETYTKFSFQDGMELPELEYEEKEDQNGEY